MELYSRGWTRAPNGAGRLSKVARPSKGGRLSKAGRQSKAAEATNLNLYVNLAHLCEEVQC